MISLLFREILVWLQLSCSNSVKLESARNLEGYRVDR